MRGIKQAPPEFTPGTGDTGIRSGLHSSLGTTARLGKQLAFRIPLELAGTARLEIARSAEERHPPRFKLAASLLRRRLFARPARNLRPRVCGWRVNHFATGGNAFWREAAAGDKLFSAARLVRFALADPVNLACPIAPPSTASSSSSSPSRRSCWWRSFGRAAAPGAVRARGMALAVFFLLLIALSEHVRFVSAYVAAASACVALLTYYLRHPPRQHCADRRICDVVRRALRRPLRPAAFGGPFAPARAALVFGVLAAIMILTRKLDWAALSAAWPLPWRIHDRLLKWTASPSRARSRLRFFFIMARRSSP